MRMYLYCFAMLFTLDASATLKCFGIVKEVQILNSGIVRLKTEGSGLNPLAYICKTDGSWKSIQTTTCNSWISSAQTALATGMQLRVEYNTNDYTACSDLPYNSLSIAPFIVGIIRN